MIPATIVGILAFAAAAGPGYLYVQLAERYGPRRDRSSLEEAAELLVVGSITTGGALLFVLWLGSTLSQNFHATGLATDAVGFIVTHPGRSLLIFGSTLALSYGIVWAAIRLDYRGRPREIQPGGTMWYAAFKQLLPAGHGTLLTIERKDGSAIAGLVASATADDTTAREILLIAPENRPLYARATPTAESVALSDTFVIVRADDISTISGHYYPVTPQT